MIRRAQVVDTTPAGEFVNVVLQDVSQCRQCARGKGCGAMLFAGPTENKGVTLRCRSEIAVRAGQAVLVEIEDHGSQWLWPVFGAFGLPLAGMLLASVFTSYFLLPESGPGVMQPGSRYSAIIEIVAAVGGLAAGIWLWRSLAPVALAQADPGLCLESARIVSTSPNP